MAREFNKNILLLISILLCNVCLSFLVSKFDGFGFNEIYVLALSKLIYIVVIFYFCNKYKLLNYRIFRLDWYLLLAFVVVYFSYNQMTALLSTADSVRSDQSHLEFIVRCLATGFFEEILFRVFVFYSLLKFLKFKKLIYPIWISSIIFGLAHLSNVLNPDYASLSVLTQIVFAVCIGFFFQSILIFTKSYVLIAVFHAIVNYFGMYQAYLFIPEIEDTTYSISELLMSFSIVIGLFFLIFYPLSLLLIRKESKKHQAEFHQMKVN